jgi:hypothetical protein
MSKFLALLRYLALYLLITLTGGAIGAWCRFAVFLNRGEAME